MTTARRAKALDRLRALLALKDYAAALKLAASWHDLGEDRDAITTAYAALQNPRFYAALKKDPEKLVEAGVAALHARVEEARIRELEAEGLSRSDAQAAYGAEQRRAGGEKS